METSVRPETFETISAFRQGPDKAFRWDCFFVLPGFMKAWWDVFGQGREAMLLSVWDKEVAVGLAPLMRDGEAAVFVGDPEVCDYLDFVIRPGSETAFFHGLLDHLAEAGPKRLDLRSLHPESTVMRRLVPLARERGHEVTVEPDGVTLGLDLPETWEDYLQGLSGKQRHEVRRKLRRLDEAGQVNYRVVDRPDDVEEAIEAFFELFRISRSDKETFLTERMTDFFRGLIRTMAREGLLRLGLLYLDEMLTAATLSFDFQDQVLLYNNGFDPAYDRLSVGLLSKVYGLKHGIEQGRRRYDFLKGDETYKYRLGGQEVRLSRCRIVL